MLLYYRQHGACRRAIIASHDASTNTGRRDGGGAATACARGASAGGGGGQIIHCSRHSASDNGVASPLSVNSHNPSSTPAGFAETSRPSMWVDEKDSTLSYIALQPRIFI